MGFRQAAVLGPVTFFLGVLFICLSIDYQNLWGTLTDEVVADGFQFYTIFYNSPPAIKALLHGTIGVGLFGLVAKLHKWDESAMFFDGSSLVAYVAAIAVYLTVIIVAIRTVVDPLVDVDTRKDQIDAMCVLSAGNIIIAILLGAILALQAGQEWANRQTLQIEATSAEVEKENKDK